MLATAFKMMSGGDTPLGPMRRSRLLVAVGVLLAITTMFSTVMPWELLQSLMNGLLGLINVVGGGGLLIGVISGKQPLRRLWLRFGITSCAMIMFGVNRLIPGQFPGGLQLLTLLLFAFTVTSLGVTIFSMTVTRISAALAAEPLVTP